MRMKCCVLEFHKFELWNEEIDAKINAVKETNLCSCEKKTWKKIRLVCLLKYIHYSKKLVKQYNQTIQLQVTRIKREPIPLKHLTQSYRKRFKVVPPDPTCFSPTKPLYNLDTIVCIEFNKHEICNCIGSNWVG